MLIRISKTSCFVEIRTGDHSETFRVCKDILPKVTDTQHLMHITLGAVAGKNDMYF